jgi:hypothetical protein
MKNWIIGLLDGWMIGKAPSGVSPLHQSIAPSIHQSIF